MGRNEGPMKRNPVKAWLAAALCAVLGTYLPACAVLDPPPKPRPQAGQLAGDQTPSFAREVAAANAAQRAQSDDRRAVMSVPPRPDTGVLAQLDLDRRGNSSLTTAKPGGATGKAEPAITLQFFEPESLKHIIEVMLRDVLKVPFVFQDGFKDKQVRLFFTANGTREQLIQTFDALIEMQGVKLRYLDGVYFVTTDEKSRRAQSSPHGIGDTTGIVRLRFMEAKEFLPIARQIMQSGDRATLLPGLNSIMLISTGGEIRAVRQLAEELDIPYFEGKSVIVYAPRYLSATAIVTMLDQQQTQLGSTSVAPNRQIEARVVPEQERVIIVTANISARDLAMEILNRVDVPTAQSRRQVFKYPLATQKAADIAATLKSLLAQVMKGVAVPVDPVPDKDSNSLFIFATPEEYAQVRSLIQRLDSRPVAVHIDVTIAEVALNDQVQFGVEWFLRNTLASADVRTSGNFNIGRTLANSIDLFVSNKGRFFILQLLGTVTDFSILSSPQLVVKNGYTAKITVGGEEPVIKSRLTTTQTAGGTNLPQTEYANQKVGLELEVTPTVGAGGEVKLTMLLKDTRLGDDKTLSDGTVQPRLATREVKTEFVAADGATVFIGGVRQRRDQASTSKTPGLGDLPGLGVLFRNKSDRAEYTEMIVLATPTVIVDQTGADRITRAILNARRDRDTGPLRDAPGAKPPDAEEKSPAVPAPAGDAPAPTGGDPVPPRGAPPPVGDPAPVRPKAPTNATASD